MNKISIVKESVNIEYTEKEKTEIIINNVLKMLINRGWIVPERKEKLSNKILSDISANQFAIKCDHVKDHVYIIFAFDRSDLKKKSVYKIAKENINDQLIFIVLNEKIVKSEREIRKYENIEFFLRIELMTDITEFIYQPKFRLLGEEEKLQILSDYGISDNKLPKIFTFDPIARYYNMKVGDILEIQRNSETTLKSIVYRVCVYGKEKN